MNKKGKQILSLILVGLLLLGSVSSLVMPVVAEEVSVNYEVSEFEDFVDTNLPNEVIEDGTDDFADMASANESGLAEETLEQDLGSFTNEEELDSMLEDLQNLDGADLQDNAQPQLPTDQGSVSEANSGTEELSDFNSENLEDFADVQDNLDEILDDFSDLEGFEDIDFEELGDALDINRPGFGKDYVQGKPKNVQVKWARTPLTTEGESSETSKRLVFYFELYDSIDKVRYYTTKLSKDLSFEDDVFVENFEDDSIKSEGFEAGDDEANKSASGIEIYKEYITDKFVNRKFSKTAKPSQEDFDKMLVSNMVILHDQEGNKLYRAERVKQDAEEVSSDVENEFAENVEIFDSQFLIHQCMNTKVTYRLAEGTELSPEDESNLGLIFTVKDIDSFGNEEEVLLNEKMIFGDGQFRDGESEWLVDATGNFKLAMRKGTLDLFEENSQIPKDYQIKVKFSNKNLADKYSLEVEGDAVKGWEVILNSRLEEIPIEVQWNDSDDENGLRPEQIVIPYTDENGEPQLLELNPENDWSGKIRVLAKQEEELDSFNALEGFDLQNMDTMRAMGANSTSEEDASQYKTSFIDLIDLAKLEESVKEELDKINSLPDAYYWEFKIEDGVIKLICELRLHTVKYKLDSESEEILAEHPVKDGDKAIELKAPVRAGYKFIEWQLDGKAFYFETPVTEDLILVAAWEEQGCTITYEYNNGMPAHKENVIKGSIAEEPEAPVKAHYRFKGWLLNGSEFSFKNPISNDITLIADWEIIKYKVVFKIGDGSEAVTQIVESGGLAQEPKDPVKKGYTFAGWYNGEDSYNFDTKVSKDLTLTAKWVKDKDNKFTVNFHPNGGKDKIDSQQVSPGEKAKQPKDPSYEGKVFLGWFYKGKDSKLKKFDFSTPIDRNYLLVAGWKNADLTVRVFGKGMQTQTQTVKYGGTIDEKVVNIPKGTRLDGWLKADGKEKFDPKEKIYKDTDIKANLIKTHTVSFDSLGGSKVEDQVVDDKTKAKEPDPPVREGYKFLGWGLTVKGKLKKFNFEKVTIDRDYKLKAVWKKQAEGGGDSGDPKQMTKIPKTGLNSSPQLSQIGILITVAGLAYFVRRKLR